MFQNNAMHDFQQSASQYNKNSNTTAKIVNNNNNNNNTLTTSNDLHWHYYYNYNYCSHSSDTKLVHLSLANLDNISTNEVTILTTTKNTINDNTTLSTTTTTTIISSLSSLSSRSRSVASTSSSVSMLISNNSSSFASNDGGSSLAQHYYYCYEPKLSYLLPCTTPLSPPPPPLSSLSFKPKLLSSFSLTFLTLPQPPSPQPAQMSPTNISLPPLPTMINMTATTVWSLMNEHFMTKNHTMLSLSLDNNNVHNVVHNDHNNVQKHNQQQQQLQQQQLLLQQQQQQSAFTLFTMRNALIIICYTAIILVSLTGNLLVCKVALFGAREMRNTTNLLIASLACSDIVMTVFNIPFNVIRMLPLSWPFGTTVCILVPLIQVSCVYVSTFTMTLIALHRLWTVRQRRNTLSRPSMSRVALTVALIWFVALSLSVPHAAFNRVKEKTYLGRVLTRCRVQQPVVWFNFPLFLTVEVFITQYLLPLSITLAVYVKIGMIIARQGALICKLSDERKRKQSEAKRRRIVMLALAVATFATCWAPINIYLLLVDTKLVSLQTDIFIMCHWFAMSSVCYNPIIYCWLNEKFRLGALQTIRSILLFIGFPIDLTKHNGAMDHLIITKSSELTDMTSI